MIAVLSCCATNRSVRRIVVLLLVSACSSAAPAAKDPTVVAIEPSRTGHSIGPELDPPGPLRPKPSKERCSTEVAQKYFEQGRELLQEGRIEAACRAFEESHGCEPAIGTAANLGTCYERLGDSASACRAWKTVLRKSRKSAQNMRALLAETRLKKLNCP